MVSYKVVWDENGNVKLECPAIGKQFAAEEISAQVLRKLVEDASKFLNDGVSKAAIIVPAYFNDSQRTATKDAVLEVGDGVFEVLSTSGDTRLGGDDFDKRIVDWLAQNFKRDEGIDLLKDKQALQRLTKTAEKAKMDLSSLTQTSISLPFITATADGPKHIDTTLTRVKFEELCSDLLDRLRGPVETALKDANLSFKDLDEVILVGGSTHIPAVQELVRKMTGKEPNVTVNPDEVVALGAAVQDGVLAGEVSYIVLLDVIPLSLGLKTLGGVMTKIIPENTTLPTSKSEGTRKKQDITITSASTLPSDEVDKMVKEAEKFAKEDKEKMDAIDTKNQADSILYQAKKQLKELGDKVPGPVKEKVEAKVKELKDAISGQSIYSQPGQLDADPASATAPRSSRSTGKTVDGDDVIEANFTDSK
ncbi:hypothetical protein CMV_026037 [Castanea mollissima]|uniref:Heat shock protein 70 n=1 Tax=Castanea mollissima TaxID=60419 RepID=A0A8J4QCF5_9ROSI|nr:hypothetical protein CMV_026037 [Castanea mollissima]